MWGAWDKAPPNFSLPLTLSLHSTLLSLALPGFIFTMEEECGLGLTLSPPPPAPCPAKAARVPVKGGCCMALALMAAAVQNRVPAEEVPLLAFGKPDQGVG